MQFICPILTKCPPIPLSSIFTMLYGDCQTALQKHINNKVSFPKYTEQKLELLGETPKREYFLASLIIAVPIVFNF